MRGSHVRLFDAAADARAFAATDVRTDAETHARALVGTDGRTDTTAHGWTYG